MAWSAQPRIYIEVLADNRKSNPAREKSTPPVSDGSFGKILHMNKLKVNTISCSCARILHVIEEW